MSEPEEFNCIELHSAIKEVANIKGVENFEYHVEYVYGKGVNYIANIFRVLLKESGKDESSISVIVKTLVNSTRQELFHELHKREEIAYTEVIPKFKLYQDHLEVNNRVTLPECLFASTENGYEIIILEDLLVNGFNMDGKLAKYERLEFNQVSLIMKELAKFHALSFIYENKNHGDFQIIKSKFGDVIFEDHFLNKSKLRTYFPEAFSMSLNVINDLSAKKKLEKLQPILLRILKSYMQPRKCNVLCHGDFWMNNILFKYKENSPTEICFLDFQAMRYASPLTDIVYFLYVCTDSEFRANYFDDLQDIYFDSLKTFLNLNGIDVNDVYPREEFNNDVTEYLPYGLLIALIELRIVTTTPEDEAILKSSKVVPGTENTEVPGEVDYYMIRVNDVVTEAVTSGVLDKLLDKINN